MFNALKGFIVLSLLCSIIGCNTNTNRNVNIIGIDPDDLEERRTPDTILLPSKPDTVKVISNPDTVKVSSKPDTVVKIDTVISKPDTIKPVTTTSPVAVQGYRYYKFVVEAMALGSSSCGILTETSFMDGDKHITTGYNVISRSDFAWETNPAIDSTYELGRMNSLFDGDVTVGSDHGNYIKFTSTPWQWVVDMGSCNKYTSLFISAHETFFYKEPSQVKVYGSNDQTSWKVIGDKKFTEVYQTASIPLSY